MFGKRIGDNAEYYFRAWVDWKFKRRIGGILVGLGVLIVAAVVGGWMLNLSFPVGDGTFAFGFSTGGTPFLFNLIAMGVALVLIGYGLILIRKDQRERDRRRVIVIEVRGLRDTSGDPLIDAVPDKVGRRVPLLVNLRRSDDGVIGDPQKALERIRSLPNDIQNHEAGADRADVSFVLGGLAPVPLSFLVGVLIDDESRVALMDWNRHEQDWATLNGADDGKRFEITGLSAVSAETAEVALAVSVSYGADLAGIAAKFPNLPLVEMRLYDVSPDAHWSQDKQIALARQFHETAIALGGKGVRHIHLILAAPNSVVLRFGRVYDKRNLPALTVYQYEQSATPPYPWGVQMPVSGLGEAKLID